MRLNFYQIMNPVIKLLGGIMLAIGLVIVDSLQLNLGVLLISLLVIYIWVEESRKPIELVGCMLCVFLLMYGIHTYFEIPSEFYLGDYNYGNIYRALYWSTYVGVLYVHWTGFYYSVSLLPFCEALNQTFHLPKTLTHRLYRFLLFFQQYDMEAKTVQKVYKAKGMALSAHSWKVFTVVVRNLRRKLDEADLAMEAKGFEAGTPSTNYTTYALEIGDALYLVMIILSMALAYYYRIW